jgi:starvation-inducible DNA-binding protein
MKPDSSQTVIGLLQDRLKEQFRWFVRAHLENADGSLATRGARTEKGTARQASARPDRDPARR